MKLIYALWDDDLADSMFSPTFHQALAGAGASRLHVNVDDDAVAATMLRITTFSEPVRAVLTVWTDDDHREVSRLVAATATRSAGWEVEERTPIVPPPTKSGERTPALAQIAFLRIPADLDEDEWLHRWQDLHTAVAIETQSTFGYTQNRVLRSVLGDQRVDAVVEELFPMEAMTDMHAFYDSGGDDEELKRRLNRMIESVVSFGADRDLDSVPTSRYVFDLTSL